MANKADDEWCSMHIGALIAAELRREYPAYLREVLDRHLYQPEEEVTADTGADDGADR